MIFPIIETIMATLKMGSHATKFSVSIGVNDQVFKAAS